MNGGGHMHKFLGKLYIKSNQRSTNHLTTRGGINTEIETKSQIKMEKHKSSDSMKKTKSKIHLPGQKQVNLSLSLSHTHTHTHTNQTSKQKMMCSNRMIQMSKSMDNICLAEDVVLSSVL